MKPSTPSQPSTSPIAPAVAVAPIRRGHSARPEHFSLKLTYHLSAILCGCFILVWAIMTVTPKRHPFFSAAQHRQSSASQRCNGVASGLRPDLTQATSAHGPVSSAPPEPVQHGHNEMIDTITLKTSRRPSMGQLEDLRSNRNPDWTTRSEELKLSGTGMSRKSLSTYNKARGQMAAFDNDGLLSRFECSAAARLNGTNGIQLKSESDVITARSALLQDARYFVPGLEEVDLVVRRLDLALTLHASPLLLDLHRHAVHPMVRREKELFYNHGKSVRTEEPMSSLRTVRFGGVNTTIQLYDKLHQIHHKRGVAHDERAHAVRVEVQLKGAEHIAKAFGFKNRGFITLADLNLKACYGVYRNILLRFENVAKVPSFEPDTASFLAILEHCPDTWRFLGGLEPLDWYRQAKGLSDKHFRALRREVSLLQLGLAQFRWADLLPEHRLPDLVDIDGDGVATIIPSPARFA